MTGQGARDDERDALIRLLDDNDPEGGVFDPDDANAMVAFWGKQADAILAAGYRKHPEPETTDAVRSHWQVIRGAQTDMLNGRPDMDALEEIALASAALDQLLGASGPWVPVGEREQ